MRKIFLAIGFLLLSAAPAFAQTNTFCPTNQNCVYTGSLTATGNGAAGNVPIKPTTTDAIQYVSPNGLDTNDGLSWGTAKLSIYAAYNALYGLATPGGTIFVAPNSACGGPVTGQGLWIMGSGDPNYATPPSGWVKAMPFSLIGVPTNNSDANSPSQTVKVVCGSTASANLPALWISSSNGGTIKNISFPGGYQTVRFGIDSNGADTDTGAVNWIFKNDDFVSGLVASGGPTIEIGSNTFNVHWDDDWAQADYNAPGGTDLRQAIVFMYLGGPSGCQSPSLQFFNNLHLNNGGIRWHNPVQQGCNNGGSLFVNGLVTENQTDGKGAVWFDKLSSYGIYEINNVEVADASPFSPPIEVDAATEQNWDALTTNSDACVPGIFVGPNESGYYTAGTGGEPSKCGTVGFHYGKVWGQTDAGRRLFSFDASRFANLAPQTPASWTNATISSGIAAPDGTTNAGQVTLGTVTFATVTKSPAVGDLVLAGVWYRVESTTGISGGIPLSIYATGCTGTALFQDIGGLLTPSSGPHILSEGENGDGQWVWASGAFKVTQAATGCALELNSVMNVTSTGYVDYFAPVLEYIPAGSGVSPTEAADMAVNLAPYPNTIAPPVVSTLPGHPIAFGGSGDSFLATLDHTALTANTIFDLPAGNGTAQTICTSVVPGPCSGSAGTGFNGGAGTSYQDAEAIAAPADPASGYDRLYIGTSDGDLHCLTSAGANCLPSSGSSAWSALTVPSANLSLAMGTDTTTFTWSNAAASFFLGQSTAATSSANVDSPEVELFGTYWNGTATANDEWFFQDEPGNGTNPTSTLAIFHSGSTGAALVSVPALTATGNISAASFTVNSSGTTPGVLELLGNTSAPALTANTFSLIGPNLATFTAYGIQVPSTAPATNTVEEFGAASGGISPITFTNAPTLSAANLTSFPTLNQSTTGTAANGTIATGTATLGTAAIASAACATVVTVAATGAVTTDVVTASFNGDPTAVTGYVPLTTGMLTIVAYPTAGDVNFKVCNNTSASITPGAITLNWAVLP